MCFELNVTIIIHRNNLSTAITYKYKCRLEKQKFCVLDIQISKKKKIQF